eukprot:4593194-Alexandrium_andersonii.AAC.1
MSLCSTGSDALKSREEHALIQLRVMWTAQFREGQLPARAARNGLARSACPLRAPSSSKLPLRADYRRA